MGKNIFPQLAGNEKIKSNLALDMANGKGSHAYIIEGEEGSGKHTLARLLCASSVCQMQADEDNIPCGECALCRRILNDNSADVSYIKLNGKASIGVDEIRSLKQTLYVTPNDSNKKFYIIENAELMTVQAQNSLLLSLEEPPEYVMFLLLAKNASSLLETIRSRAPIIRMESFSSKQVLDYLNSGRFISPSDYSQENLIEAAALSHGAIGQAVSYLKSLDSENSLRSIAAELTEIFIGKSRKSELFEYMSENVFPLERVQVLELIILIQTALRDIIAAKKTSKTSMADGDYLMFYLSENDIPKAANRTSIRKIISLYESFKNAHESISINGSVQAALTKAILKKD